MQRLESPTHAARGPYYIILLLVCAVDQTGTTAIRAVFGTQGGVRSLDLAIISRVLYQLSYLCIDSRHIKTDSNRIDRLKDDCINHYAI